MSNDHYVPQSFLRAWSFDPGQNKVYRYQRIPATGKVVFGERSIRSIASIEDLYSVSDGVDRASFEQDVMSRTVDDPISKALAAFRAKSLAELTDQQRDELGRLILTIEVRNPATIEKMKLTQATLDEISAKASGNADPARIQETIQLLTRMQPSTGAWAAGMYSSWGYGRDLQALKRKRWMQVDVVGTGGKFVTSNYPAMGGSILPFEHVNHFSSLAVTPTRALMISSPDNLERFKRDSPEVVTRAINLMSIAGAHEAYSDCAVKDPWIEKHLGWSKRVDPGDRASYFSTALQD